MNPPPVPPLIPPLPPVQTRTSVSFSLNPWEVLCCRLLYVIQTPILVGFMVVVSAFPAFRVAMKRPTPVSQAFVFVFGLVIMLGIMAIFQITLHTLMILLKPSPGVVGGHFFEIREDGLFERTDVNEAVYRWAGVSRVSQAMGFLFVYVGGNMVHYIPKSSFASAEAFRSFRAEIEGRAKAAKER